MVGYKGFNSDLSCNPDGKKFQYEVGQTYEHKGKIELCGSGFHFCKKLVDVHSFYNLQNDKNRFCEVEAFENIIEDTNKCVTNKIKILRELTKEEINEMTNTGKGNTGIGNTGDSNTGYWNTGDRNTGYWNTGDRNTGYWNKTNRSSGVFCNEEPKLILFNKKTDMTFEECRNTRAFDILNNVEKSKWIYFSKMTYKEKADNKSAETCDGYLKEIPRKEASTEWWTNLDDTDKLEIFNLPNFNLDIFNDIMELEISKKEYKKVKTNG